MVTQIMTLIWVLHCQQGFTFEAEPILTLAQNLGAFTVSLLRPSRSFADTRNER